MADAEVDEGRRTEDGSSVADSCPFGCCTWDDLAERSFETVALMACFIDT